MVKPRYVAHHQEARRDIYLLALDRIDTPYELDDLRKQQFVCLCALDAERLATHDVSEFCCGLLKAGCAYFCAWGPGCERIHDIMDEQIVGDNPPETDLGVVLTTWHSEDSLAEAISYFLWRTEPESDYAPDGCAAGVVVTVAGNEWISEIEQCILEELK